MTAIEVINRSQSFKTVFFESKVNHLVHILVSWNGGKFLLVVSKSYFYWSIILAGDVYK